MKHTLCPDTLMDLSYRLKALRVSNEKEFKYRSRDEWEADVHRAHIDNDIKYIEAKVNQLLDEYKTNNK